MKTLIGKSIFGAGLLLSGLGMASAATVNSVLFNGEQLLSDNSAEYQSHDADSDGRLDVGDRLRGIFSMGTVEQGGVTRNFGTGGNNELSGIFEVEVTNKLSIDTGGGVFIHQFTFAPYAGFATEAVGKGWAAGPATGAAVVFFDDATPDYARTNVAGNDCEVARGLAAGTATRADLEGCATDGSVMWVVGFDTASTAWRTGFLDTDSPGSIGNAVIGGGSFSVALNVLEYGIGPQLLRNVSSFAGGFVDMSGQGGLLSIPTSERTGVYDLYNNIDFTISTAGVPEPNVMFLFGAGLIGFGVYRRKFFA